MSRQAIGRTKDRIAELKRRRQILNGATVTMLFDLLLLWFEEKT